MTAGLLGSSARETNVLTTLLYRLRRIAAGLQRIVGAPDYERYVAHLRARHPGVEPLAPDEFYRMRLEDRYSRPGAKCC